VRILVLSALYPPAAVGGYERLCRDAVERFRRHGHEVAVLTSTFGGLHQDADPNVHRLVPIYWDGGELVCPPRLELFRAERKNARTFRRILAEFEPDVISVWAMGAWSLGLLTAAEASRVPVLYNVIDGWLVYGRRADCWTARLDNRRQIVRRIAAALDAPGAPRAFAHTSTFCFVSEFTRSDAAQHAGIDLATASTTVVPAGIDTSDFPLADPDEPRPWRWRLVFVGRLAPEKGLDVAIRAHARIPEARLTVVGEGGPDWYHGELRRTVESDGTGDRIAWTQCARSELAPLYRAGDVLVFPSTGSEPFGLVPLEAMACATPVVATTGGGSQEYLIDGENCLQLEPGDVDGLVAALQRLSQDAELRRRLVTGGLRTAATLTVDRWADTLEALHLAAAERHGLEKTGRRRF
jgi:glycogen(starch) synthase